MWAWLIGLPLIAGAAVLARLAARRWRRGAVVLAGIGVLLMAGAAVLLVVAVTADPAAAAAGAAAAKAAAGLAGTRPP